MIDSINTKYHIIMVSAYLYMYIEELPFPQNATLIQMTGNEVLQAIEQMLPPRCQSPSPIGSYPHLSSGLSATYCLDIHKIIPNTTKIGEKVVELKVNGENIDLEKIYNVATTSFYVYESGDHVTAFSNKSIICNHNIITCGGLMIEYLRTLDSISGEPPLRLINLEN